MISTNVFSEEKAWSKRLKNKDIFFKKICKAFPKKYKFLNKKVTLTLLLSNNQNIKKLNKLFRKKNKSTDILSFPLDKKIKISSKGGNLQFASFKDKLKMTGPATNVFSGTID